VQNRFIQLIEEETITLREGMKNGTAHLFRKRCHCLILSSEGYQVKDLAEVFSVSLNTIYGWLNRWETKGVVGLRDKAGQRQKTDFDDCRFRASQTTSAGERPTIARCTSATQSGVRA
jgi:uncharacterized protein YjcR